MNPITTNGLSGMDASIPAGATITKTSWHVAGTYGPGPEHPTEADAIHHAIERYYADKAAYDVQQGAGAAIWPYTGRVPSVDLRWHLTWPQGAPDANGRSTVASGIEQTVRRTTYESVEQAEAHLARIVATPKGPLFTAWQQETEEHRMAWAAAHPDRVLCDHDLTERCYPTSVTT